MGQSQIYFTLFYVTNNEVRKLLGFYGISTFVGYLTPNPFFVSNQFYFKQFNLAWVHSLIVKNISISNYLVYSNSSNSGYPV